MTDTKNIKQTELLYFEAERNVGNNFVITDVKGNHSLSLMKNLSNAIECVEGSRINDEKVRYVYAHYHIDESEDSGHIIPTKLHRIIIDSLISNFKLKYDIDDRIGAIKTTLITRQ